MADVTPQASPHPAFGATAGTRRGILGSLVIVAMAGVLSAGPASASGCTAPHDLISLHAPLPIFLGAVRAQSPIRIVALGSSSTSGTGASGPTRSYPARLEQELRAVWPGRDVRVINAGVAGHLARDMVARIDRDVLPHQPQLVVWQTGVNDAIRGVPIEAFKQQLRTGIERIRAAGSDVAILDQQFFPAFGKLKDGQLYLAAVRQTAEQLGVPVIQRFRIMQHLIETAQFTTATLLAPDQFHLNDQAYDCIGHLLAKLLQSGVPSQPPLADAVKGPL